MQFENFKLVFIFLGMPVFEFSYVDTGITFIRLPVDFCCAAMVELAGDEHANFSCSTISYLI